MTTNNRQDDKKPEKPGKDQRPHATLDLTAEDLSQKEQASKKETVGASSSAAQQEDREQNSRPSLEGSDDRPSSSSPSSAMSLTSHLSAGALGAVLALIFSYAVFWNDDSPRAPVEQIDSLRTELEATQEKLSALETDLAETASASQDLQSTQDNLAQMNQSLDRLSSRIAAVEQRPAAGGATQQAVQQSLDPLTARLSDLEQRLDSIGQTQNEMRTDARASALALALYNLRRAADDGEPFQTELTSIAEMSPVPLELATLEELGDQGVSSVEDLKAGFESAANAAIEAENESSEDSVGSGLWSRVSSLVQVRRKGNIPGDGTRAILARTEYQLERGDLRTALSEAEQLTGKPKQAMAGWIESLRTKIAAEDALDRVEAKLLTALGSGQPARRGG